MNKKQKTVTLKDICKAESGKRPSQKEKNNTEYFSCGGEHIMKSHRINYEKNDWFISKDFYEKLNRGKLYEDSILLVKDGATIGKCMYFQPQKEKYITAINSHVYKIVTNSNECLNKYLYYFICSQEGQSKIKRCITGAAQPGLNRKFLELVELTLFPLNIQKKIASILSAYDELIENNNKRIKILEEMAHTIYKEWFVNFKFPGHENVKMVASELGKIPEGWKQKFKEFVDFKEGPGLRTYQYKKSGIPFLNIRTMNDNEIDFSKVKYLDKIEVKDRYSHFLLSENDHIVSSSGTIGRIVTIRNTHLPLMLNTSIIRMRSKDARILTWQLKHFLKSKYYQNQIKSYAIGAAQKNYGPTHLKQMNIIVPSKEISKKYESITGPLEDEIKVLLDKNLNLKKFRDILLPKLISGEIDVSDLDIEVIE